MNRLQMDTKNLLHWKMAYLVFTFWLIVSSKWSAAMVTRFNASAKYNHQKYYTFDDNF